MNKQPSPKKTAFTTRATIQLSLEDLPPFQSVKRTTKRGTVQQPTLKTPSARPLIQQLTRYFRRLVIQYHRDVKTWNNQLLLPSVPALSGFFHCSELEILKALNELPQTDCQYEISALDRPLSLKGPYYNQHHGRIAVHHS